MVVEIALRIPAAGEAVIARLGCLGWVVSQILCPVRGGSMKVSGHSRGGLGDEC